jgi:hypothetical protein
MLLQEPELKTREGEFHQNKYFERDDSIISILERPTAVIAKAFLEFIIGTGQSFQVVESQQLENSYIVVKHSLNISLSHWNEMLLKTDW